MMPLPKVIEDESLEVCFMGNLRGVKDTRMMRDFEACTGWAGAEKFKKAVSLNFGHLTFASQDQKRESLTAIQDLIFKNKKICFSVRKVREPDLKKARLNAEDINIQDIVTPLWKMNYEEQLAHKARFINQSLFHVTKRTLTDCKDSPPQWIQKMYDQAVDFSDPVN